MKVYEKYLSTLLMPLCLALASVVGSSVYFLLSFEPSVQHAVYGSVFCIVLTAVLGRLPKLILPCCFLLFASLMFTWTTYRVQSLNTIMLAEEYSDRRYWVVGEIAEVEKWDRRGRVTIVDPEIYGVPEDSTPKKVRVSAPVSVLQDFKSGQWISIQAKLMSISTPEYPGQMDYRRYAYLNGIGAQGYAMGEVYRTSHPKWDERITFSYYVERVRQSIHERIMAYGYEGSALSSSLLTGIRDRLPKDLVDDFRASGLSHILAISGLHVGLVGGLIFFALRRLIGFSPQITLRFSTKKIAAVLAMFACIGYMLLAGMTTPTIRACLMLSLLFIAVLMERFRIGLRALMVAVILILMVHPEDVITASFQMSFAAAAALLIWAELSAKQDFSEIKVVQAFGYVKGVWGASLVAGLVTLPIAAYHFHYVSLSGFVANLLAIPLTGFVVLPLGVLSLIFMPVGLDKPFIWLMGESVGVLSYIASVAADTDVSQIYISEYQWALFMVGCLLLLALLYWRRAKWFVPTGFVVIVLCSVLAFVQESPDLIFLRGNKTVLLKMEDGSYVHALSDGSYDERRLLKRYVAEKNIVLDDAPYGQCDSVGCVYSVKGKQLLFMNEGVFPSYEDCVENDLVFGAQHAECSSLDSALYQEVRFGAGLTNVEAYHSPSLRVWNP